MRMTNWATHYWQACSFWCTTVHSSSRRWIMCAEIHRFNPPRTYERDTDSVVCTDTLLWLDWFGVQSRRRHEILFSPHPLRPALLPTQPPVQWKTGLFLGEGGNSSRGVALTAHSPCSAKIKNDWSSTSIPPSCLHGVSRGKFHFYLRLTYLIPLMSKHPPQYIFLNSSGHFLSFGWKDTLPTHIKTQGRLFP